MNALWIWLAVIVVVAVVCWLLASTAMDVILPPDDE